MEEQGNPDTSVSSIPSFLHSSIPPSSRGRRFAVVIYLVAAVLLLVLLDARTRGLLESSFLLAALTAAAVVPIGLVIATLLVKVAVPGRRFSWILLVSGLFLPLYFVATAWDAALGLQGWVAELMPAASGPAPVLSGWSGAVFVHGVALLPAVTLLIAAGLASVERELEEDALLRVAPAVVLMRVTWRRGLDGVMAAIVWVFVVCLGEMTVTDLFQIRTFAEEIYVQTAGGPLLGLAADPDSPGTSSTSFWLATLVIALVLVPAIWWCLRLGRRWRRVGDGRRWMVETGQGGWAMGVVVALALAGLIGFPLGSLLYQAGLAAERIDGQFVSSWSLSKALYEAARAPRIHFEEFLSTAVVAAAAATGATAIAALLGVWSAAGTVGKLISAGIASILAAIPGSLLGVWIIRVLNQPPDSPLWFLAALYDEAAFGFAPWLAQTLRVLPFAVIVLVVALSNTPRSLLDAATLDGAGLFRKFVHVFAPLHWRSFAIAWLVSFVLAAGELPATVLVAPPGVTPLSVRIFTLVHYGVDDQLAGLVLFVWASVLVATAAVFFFARSIWIRFDPRLGSPREQ